MKQATFISELLILVVALALSVLADILPAIGRVSGKLAGRLYRNRYRAVAWLKIAYSWLRWGRFGRIYTSNYLLADYDPDFIRDFNVDRHCGTLNRYHACDRYRMALCIVRKLQRRLTALYRTIYGMIAQWLIAQNGIPATVPDPRIVKIQRQQWIRSLMANY